MGVQRRAGVWALREREKIRRGIGWGVEKEKKRSVKRERGSLKDEKMKEAEWARGRKGMRETVVGEILYTCHFLPGSTISVVEKCWWVVFQWAFQLRKKCLLALAGMEKGLRNSSLASRFCLKTLQRPAFSIFSSYLFSFSFSYSFLSLLPLCSHVMVSQ